MEHESGLLCLCNAGPPPAKPLFGTTRGAARCPRGDSYGVKGLTLLRWLIIKSRCEPPSGCTCEAWVLEGAWQQAQNSQIKSHQAKRRCQTIFVLSHWHRGHFTAPRIDADCGMLAAEVICISSCACNASGLDGAWPQAQNFGMESHSTLLTNQREHQEPVFLIDHVKIYVSENWRWLQR